jgi:hypothetical protein
MNRRIATWAGIFIFLLGIVGDMALQERMRPFAVHGVYFHPWSSEDMMQTVPLRALRDDPLQSLTHIHIQPPAFDLLRAVLVQLWPSLNDGDALVRVDESLYALWAVVFGLLGVVVFAWLSRQCGMATAGAASILLLLHPASIFFATYLDSTLLSAFLVLLAYYLLWKIANGHHASVLPFSVATVLLFFTRSIFQLPSIAMFALCLYLLRVPRKQLITYVLVTGLLSGLYVVKQHFMFGLLSTSSFAGLNLANSIGVGVGAANYSRYLADPSHLRITDPQLPEVLTSETKLDGQPNFNNINYLSLNDDLLQRYEKRLRGASIGELAKSYLDNAAIYFKPSSTYSSHHVIVDRLPWTDWYNRIFSAPVLPALLVLAIAGWSIRMVKSGSYARALGLAMPGLYVFLVSIISDKGENMRFKFFLEPVMFVFLASQFCVWVRVMHKRARTRRQL